MTASIEALLNHLTGAVHRSLRMTNDAAIAVRGDVPSAVLAAIARDQADVPLTLVWLRVRPEEDPRPVRALARRLRLSLLERVVDPMEEPEPLEEAERVVAEAGLLTRRLIFSQGWRALYERPPGPLPPPAGTLRGVEIRRPYLDRGVLHLAQTEGIEAEALVRIAQRLDLGDTLPSLRPFAPPSPVSHS